MLFSNRRVTRPVKQCPEVEKSRLMPLIGISGGRFDSGGEHEDVLVFELDAAIVF